MSPISNLDTILEQLPRFRAAAEELKQSLLTNLIMIGEVPAPTFGEAERITFLENRFTECGLHSCSVDEVGNGLGVIPGTVGESHILVVAHADTVFGPDVDHHVTVLPDRVIGAGLGDNSLGLAFLATLSMLLERLDIRLQHNLLLMGCTRSLGRGNLEGIRFFLENNRLPIVAGVCVEGVQLGRLSYKSVGMIRSELTVSVPDEFDWTRFGVQGAISTLTEVVQRILEIPRPARPRTSVVLGAVQGGTSFSKIASNASLRFEVRSESAEVVDNVWRQIEDIVAELSSETGAEISLDVLAKRHPGGIEFSHPLVAATRGIMEAAGISSHVAPSTSEMSALIDAGTPALTLGVTKSHNLDKPREEIEIESMFTGVAQLLGVILAIDGGCCEEG